MANDNRFVSSPEANRGASGNNPSCSTAVCGNTLQLKPSGEDNVRCVWRRHVLAALISETRNVNAGEKALARAQENRRDGNVHFINETGAQVLPDGRHPASKPHILAVCIEFAQFSQCNTVASGPAIGKSSGSPFIQPAHTKCYPREMSKQNGLTKRQSGSAYDRLISNRRGKKGNSASKSEGTLRYIRLRTRRLTRYTGTRKKSFRCCLTSFK
jgi:hypothetical protein